MTDYRRMVWQYWTNKIAVWVLVALILLDADEVAWALRYHWPWWDEVMMMITTPLTGVCWFLKRHTDMYRIDL